MPSSVADVRCELRFELKSGAGPDEHLAAWLAWKPSAAKYVALVTAHLLRIIKVGDDDRGTLLQSRPISLQPEQKYWLGLTLAPGMLGGPLQIIAAIWPDSAQDGRSYRLVALDPPEGSSVGEDGTVWTVAQ